MARADSHDTTNLSGLARQEAERVQPIRTLLAARREARLQINRLIDFLDQSDPYVMTELEDEADLEDVGDSEPALSFLPGEPR